MSALSDPDNLQLTDPAVTGDAAADDAWRDLVGIDVEPEADTDA